MGRIRVLPDVVANRIAAGEVVERPASVAKELLENSLDAGASEVRLEVEAGGRRLLRVSDDGCGMMRDDALLAFERHATSKLSSEKDLLSIATLGFRGEALPSIASVSRLLLETRSSDETTGTLIEMAGGKLLRCDERARTPGTTITIRDLFYNVPARKKFLRSEPTELAHTAALVTHYSLAHPDKTFSLRHNGNVLLEVTPVSTLAERVFQVFGGKLMEELVTLGEHERELRLPPAEPDAEPVQMTVRLRGFVSEPQVQRYNRSSIFLFVNGRLIRDKLLLHALSAAYHNLMPSGCYPFALLFLECDRDEVDVNVHPAKTEVRFRHGPFVHDFVRDAVRHSLMQSRTAAAMPAPAPVEESQPAVALPYSEFSSQVLEDVYASALPQAELPTEAVPSGLPDRVEGPARQQHEPQSNGIPASPVPTKEAGEQASSATPTALYQPAATVRTKVPDTHSAAALQVPLDASLELSRLSDLRPLGQLHDSFIIAAGRDGLWLIDQHVAHERILFEQILARRAAGTAERQQLLLPLIVELTPAQQFHYARLAEELEGLGFDTEHFGQRTLAVKAAPAGIAPSDIEKALSEALDQREDEARGTTLDEVRANIAATLACRSAIKINTPLEPRKMEWLLQALAHTQYPMTCPHGRPIALRYTMRDILKSFHRI